ncbi:acyl carrier protein phosphodiesterase [Fulvivirgaceae bacterium BMA12]|uniref:Acyl carrier protein phosphodiesterase n=1 Tax=Agaribacillus aureus TaxID=3051825 RepID=A0ABT8L959_9BACT|nr:acyl carrier protein phosphodiesterase [Fulvivirgaceae bacterium BMA12]
MNFLAHIYLSGEMDDLMVGNFIGDFVKGKKFENYSQQMVNGIKLHREIDWFTDNHQTVEKSKDRLWKKYRHYAGVIIDMFYDHFLAKDWAVYSRETLDDFTQKAYNVLLKKKAVLPQKAQHMLPYMIKNNWLLAYQHVEGIEKALQGMAKRTTFESNMEKAGDDLREDYELFGQEFHEFFPEIIDHTTNFKNNL